MRMFCLSVDAIYVFGALRHCFTATLSNPGVLGLGVRVLFLLGRCYLNTMLID